MLLLLRGKLVVCLDNAGLGLGPRLQLLELDLAAKEQAKKDADTELLGVREYVAQLHAQCDFLVQNFDLRKEARTEESDALKQAKAILSGAKFEEFL